MSSSRATCSWANSAADFCELIGKLAAGVGQRSPGVGGFAGGVGAAPLPCPLAGLVHLLCGQRGGFGGLLGLQAGELAREPFRLLAQLLLDACRAAATGDRGLSVLVLGGGLDLFLQVLLPLFEGGKIGFDAAEFCDGKEPAGILYTGV